MAVARVLIVEDDPDSNEALRLLLEEAGYDVRVAFSAQEAAAAAAEHVPDVALIDIGLPGLDGIDLLIALRSVQKLRRCRYIALTGYAALGLPERAREAGFDRFLLKPVGSETVLRTVTALADSRGGAAEFDDRASDGHESGDGQ